MGYKIVKVDPEDDWLPQTFRLKSFPIAKSPATRPKDIVGTAFVIEHENANCARIP